MFDLQAGFNIASVAVGFIAAVCFCVGAATNSPKNIALSSATIVGGNPATMRSLSSQRAQYLTGAVLLVVSFGFQVLVVATPQGTQVSVPSWLQSPVTLLVTILAVGSIAAFAATRWLTERTYQAAAGSLEQMRQAQSRK